MKRRWFSLLIAVLLTLPLATTVWAGGIVVSLEGAVPAAQAGTPFTVQFTIRSMHDSSLQEGFTPIVLATDTQTGETVRVEATELAERGHYAATLTLPSAGEWRWQITPMADYPSEFVLELTPLQVQPAGAAAAAPPTTVSWLGTPATLGLLILAVALVVLVGLLAVRRRAAVRA